MGLFDAINAPITTDPTYNPAPWQTRIGLFGAGLKDVGADLSGRPEDAVNLTAFQQLQRQLAMQKGYSNALGTMFAQGGDPNSVSVTPQVQTDASGNAIPNDPSVYQQPSETAAGPLADRAAILPLLKAMPADQGIPALMTMLSPHGVDTVTDAQGVVHKIDKLTGQDMGTIGNPKLQEVDPTKLYYQPNGANGPQTPNAPAQVSPQPNTQAITDAFGKADPTVQQAIQGISDPTTRAFAAYMGKGESGFNPSAVNPKNPGVAGLFQFDLPTWKLATGQSIPANVAGTAQDPRLDPKQAAQAFASLTQSNAQSFQNTFGRQPDLGDLAVYHQQGAAGGSALIGADPSAPAAQVLATAIKQAAPGISPQQAQQIAQKRMTSNGIPANATAGQMLGIVKNYYVPGSGGGAPPSSSTPAPNRPNIPGMTFVGGGQQVERPMTPAELKSYNALPGSTINTVTGVATRATAYNSPSMLNDPATQQAAQTYIKTGQLPHGMGRGGAAQAAMMNAVAGMKPEDMSESDWAAQLANNAQNYKSGQAALTNFDQGKLGNQVRSFSVGISHLNTLQQLSNAMANGNVQALNSLKNKFQTQFGKPAPSNFNAARDIVGDEIVKAIVGSGGGVADRDKTAATINAAQSPAQLAGVIATYKTLMAGQLRGLAQQYQAATGRNDFATRLSPEARTMLSPPPSPQNLPRVGQQQPTIIKYDAQGNRIQ